LGAAIDEDDLLDHRRAIALLLVAIVATLTAIAAHAATAIRAAVELTRSALFALRLRLRLRLSLLLGRGGWRRSFSGGWCDVRGRGIRRSGFGAHAVFLEFEA